MGNIGTRGGGVSGGHASCSSELEESDLIHDVSHTVESIINTSREGEMCDNCPRKAEYVLVVHWLVSGRKESMEQGVYCWKCADVRC